MRISDWSSDLCSSDLQTRSNHFARLTCLLDTADVNVITRLGWLSLTHGKSCILYRVYRRWCGPRGWFVWFISAKASIKVTTCCATCPPSLPHLALESHGCAILVIGI